MRRVLWIGLLALAAGCGAGPAPARAPNLVLIGADGVDSLLDRAARANLTVLVFTTSHCPILKVHEGRLRQLVATYTPRGVSFVAVAEEDERASDRLGIPMVVDRDAALARALGVEYSTHTVVLDRRGYILYSGGLDSDRAHLTGSARLHLVAALDDALAGRHVRTARTEALGCPLRR